MINAIDLNMFIYWIVVTVSVVRCNMVRADEF